MAKHVFLAACGSLLLAAGGCVESGLSTRETPGNGMSAYTYSLYDTPTLQPEARPVLKFPASVAVAQVGEVAPPSAVIATLRDPAIFRTVLPIPYPGTGNNAEDPQQMGRMVKLAADMGADYLLVMGGTIDSVNQDNGLSLLDLTIVGAYVVPSRDVRAEAKGTAALIDVKSGKVALISTADATHASSETTASAEDKSLQMHQALRDEVLRRLADHVIADCRAQADEGKRD